MGLFDSRSRFADDTDYLKDKWGQEIVFTHIATGRKVDFKAFIKSFSDKYNQKWKATSGYGRMDAVQTFEGTTRSISISFDVVAASIEEAKQNLSKISTFANMLYPVFDGAPGGQTIKSAPLVRLKFMNWADSISGLGAGEGLLGAMGGFDFNPNTEMGVFQEKSGVMYPKSLALSINLNVIHEHQLGWIEGEQTSEEGKKIIYEEQEPTFPYGVHGDGWTPPDPIAREEDKKPKNPDNAKAKENAVVTNPKGTGRMTPM